MLKYLRLLKIDKKPYETISQFIDRLEKNDDGFMSQFTYQFEKNDDESLSGLNSEHPLRNISDILSMACYGNGEVSSSDVEYLQDMVRRMNESMYRMFGGVRYFYRKYWVTMFSI